MSLGQGGSIHSPEAEHQTILTYAGKTETKDVRRKRVEERSSNVAGGKKKRGEKIGEEIAFLSEQDTQALCWGKTYRRVDRNEGKNLRRSIEKSCQ